ncbi:hypothetical protein D6D10_00545 [Aureobasidium pullulans]|uniref:Small secreted protein n=1 Tax=Aureobasidium pullulans TaxID=5580 RepID=A0A4V4J9K5_AURPU|nr:hypothetical protein D6D10_00545 [Aureobasidium pullulans]
MHYYLTTTIFSLLCAGAQAYDYLTATALVTNAANQSALECWRLSTPLVDSSEPGIAGSLRFNFNASSASYTIIPPRFNGGRHNDPTPQLVVYTSGLAHISLPSSKDEAWFIGGNQGILIATDMTGGGHITEYPSEQYTSVITVPFPDGLVPAHEKVSSGACHFSSIGGRSLEDRLWH